MDFIAAASRSRYTLRLLLLLMLPLLILILIWLLIAIDCLFACHDFLRLMFRLSLLPPPLSC